MPLIAGNTSTSFTSGAYENSVFITGFSLANKSGGSMTVSIGILYGSTFYVLYNHSLSAGESYVYSGNEILIPVGHTIYISSSASCDYVITIK